MEQSSQQLVATLDAAAVLLEQCGERYWSVWLRKDAELIRRGDFYGIEHLLSAYGGMGSFNDLVLCRTNEQSRLDPMPKENELLDQLRERAWELANAIKRCNSTTVGERT